MTGWTILHTIRNNAFVHVHAGLEHIVKQAPLPIAGMDFDNGSEFINWSVIAWCDDHDIPLTRGRPYQHNDNAHLKQRNGDWIRRHAFRYRYETDAELTPLNTLWTLVMARKNHLLPCVKAVGWTHTSTGRKKRVYDKPKTPYARLLDTGTPTRHTPPPNSPRTSHVRHPSITPGHLDVRQDGPDRLDPGRALEADCAQLSNIRHRR